MNAPSHFSDTAPAPLSARILAGIFTDLPEHYTDAEWTEAARAAQDCEDEAPLLHMVEVGREADRERQWKRETGRYSLNDYLDGNGPHPLKGVVL